MNLPDVPSHDIITKEYIIKYIADSVGIREFLVTDKGYRKELYSRIERVISFRKSQGYFNDADELQKIQKLFTKLSLNNQLSLNN